MAECEMLLRCVGLVQSAAANNEPSGRVACVFDVKNEQRLDLTMCSVDIRIVY